MTETYSLIGTAKQLAHVYNGTKLFSICDCNMGMYAPNLSIYVVQRVYVD